MNNIQEYCIEILDLAKKKFVQIDAIYLSYFIAGCCDELDEWVEDGEINAKCAQELENAWATKYNDIYKNQYDGCFPAYNGDGATNNNPDYGSLWLLYVTERGPSKLEQKYICDDIESSIKYWSDDVYKYDMLIDHLRVKLLVLKYYIDHKTDHDRSHRKIKNALLNIDNRYDEFIKYHKYAYDRFNKFKNVDINNK